MEVHSSLVKTNQGAVVVVQLRVRNLRVVNLRTVLIKQMLIELRCLTPILAEHTLHPSRALNHLLTYTKLCLLQLLYGVNLSSVLLGHWRTITSGLVCSIEWIVVPPLGIA